MQREVKIYSKELLQNETGLFVPFSFVKKLGARRALLLAILLRLEKEGQQKGFFVDGWFPAPNVTIARCLGQQYDVTKIKAFLKTLVNAGYVESRTRGYPKICWARINKDEVRKLYE